MKIRPVGAKSLHAAHRRTYERTDRHDEANSSFLKIWRTSLKMVLIQHQYFGQSIRKKERERRKEERKKERK